LNFDQKNILRFFVHISPVRVHYYYIS
jgi:hypothetical protein